MSNAVPIARDALAGRPAWLVGGAIRDRLLERRPAGPEDVDLAIAGDVEPAARAVARASGGAPFRLSEAFGAWRVVARDGAWRIDLAPLQGETIEQDLGQRDFTVNAMAEPLGGGELLDPTGGRTDLSGQRLRAVSKESFARDPLRTLRLPRFVAELGFEPERETGRMASLHAGGLADVSPERIFAELKAMVCSPSALSGLNLCDELGLTAQVLPELSALRGVDQSRYHHLDVHDHTLAVLESVIEIERAPHDAFGSCGDDVGELLSEPLADGLTRGEALRFGALLHDAAKPRTRHDFGGGRVGFPGHDALGADIARAALARLRAGERLQAHVAALTRHHLRLGFLVHERPLSRRTVYRYLRACEPVEVDVTVLSVADRLATRGRKADEAIGKHLELARELLGDALAWRAAGRPAPLVRGDELAAELALEPGPRLGELLAQLEEDHFAGEISNRREALARARELLSG
jgi:tRNA nucleotidyltransferase/poly(A) polymerase